MRELPDELLNELLGRMTALERPPGQLLFESLHGAFNDALQAPRRSGFARQRSTSARWRPGETATTTSNHRLGARLGSRDRAVVGQRRLSQLHASGRPIERVRAAFGDEAFKRLQTLKSRHDPNNILRRNQNIPPGPD